ncbi:MAG: Dabb family protein [Verrucomicrobiota bacterium]
MKSLLLVLVVLVLGAGSVVGAAPPPRKKARLLRHEVAFKFKEGTPAAEIQRVEDAFAGLKAKIPQIQSFETGLNNSPEGLNKGCTHGFILTFHSEKDRDAYLVHPDHKQFGKLVGPLLADVFVIDFWARH